VIEPEEPHIRLTPAERAVLRRRIHEQLQEALRGVDARLAQAFADFDRTGRRPDDEERERIRAQIALTGGRF
jgi:hypothetical protein